MVRAGAASCLVAGFDLATGSWVSTAHAEQFVPVPPLDGQLSFEPGEVEAAADDFGHIVSNSPLAVLHPGSIDDVAAMVRFARDNSLHIAMRGQGHSQYGQAQVSSGIVVDSRGLASIEEIGEDYAVVQAGTLWSELVNAAYVDGLTPPVLTDYLELSIGGTLSVGGIGGAMQHHGLQADNVLELEVVTGRGDRVVCSNHHRRFLFRSVLGGMGQSALIVRAKIRLVAAEAQARVFLLYYDNLQTYLSDQQLLLADGRFNYLEGQALPNTTEDGWRYMIEAAAYFTSPATPDNTTLLTGLSDNTQSREINNVPYLEFAFRLAPLVEQLKALGIWDFPHPWLNLWVPASEAASYFQEVFDNLTLADTGQGPVLLYPVNTTKVGIPSFRLPNELVCFSFNLLKTASPAPGAADAMVVHNRSLYDAVESVGGTRYTSGALPFTSSEWRRHFGPIWFALLLAKLLYDPDRVLTPGPDIF